MKHQLILLKDLCEEYYDTGNKCSEKVILTIQEASAALERDNVQTKSSQEPCDSLRLIAGSYIPYWDNATLAQADNLGMI